MATVPIVTEKTYSEIAALIAASELNLALSYKITDRGDNGLLFRAAAPNRLENDGLRYMFCPATYTTGVDAYENDWIGVWNATKQATATEGQLTIWNGLVWVAGVTMDGLAPDTETSGWTVITKASFTNHEYIEMTLGITYDFENDWINKQWDGKDNCFGLSKNESILLFGDEINRIDYCDFNQDSIYNNKCALCYNNSNGEGIRHNECFIVGSNYNSSWIQYNSILGSISANSNLNDISNNRNMGNISDNSNSETISNNTNNGDISNNSNNGRITLNTNNGDISNNSSEEGFTTHITFNNNNGFITGNVLNSDLSDAIVDKGSD